MKPRKPPISRRAFQTDFRGEWSLEYDPFEAFYTFFKALMITRSLGGD